MKFEDLLNYNIAVFMFNIALNKHPDSIVNLFTKSKNFNRNLEFLLKKVDLHYLKKQVPHSLVKSWNNLHLSDKNWLRVKPEVKTKVNKNSNNPAKLIPSNNSEHYKFRLDNFKKSLKQQIFGNYKAIVNCKNKY